MVVVFGLRLPYVDELVINQDESMFWVVAQDLAHGGTLYVTAWESKEPLLFAVLVPVIRLFGASVPALRLYTTFYLLASMLVVDLLGRRLFGRAVSFAPALLFGAFFSVPRFNGLASMAELFMSLPVGLALLGLTRYLEDDRRGWWLFLCGAMGAVAVLIRFQAAYSVVIVPLLLLVRQLLRPPASLARLAREAAWCAAGGVVVVGLVVLAFVAAGNLFELGFVYRYNVEYLRTVPSDEAWTTLGWFMAWNALHDPFTMLGLGGVILALVTWRRSADRRLTSWLVLGLLLTSFLGVGLGRNVFFHYYLGMGLPLALAFGLGLSLVDVAGRDWARLSLVGLALLAASSFSPYRFEAVERRRDRVRDDSVRRVATYLREHSAAEDRVFVLGGDSVIYFLAERRAPTRYFVWLHHWGRFREVLARLGVNDAGMLPERPRFFVYRPTPERVAELEALLARDYEVRERIGEYVIAELRASGP